MAEAPTKDRLDDAGAAAVRLVDLTHGLRPITDVVRYRRVWVYGKWRGRIIGRAVVENNHREVSAATLREALVAELRDALLEAILADRLGVTDGTAGPGAPVALPPDVAVSVVIATRDRPEDLRACLRHLAAQATPRQVEVIVVDNNPGSNLTPPVVAEFPNATLAAETRPGLSYARNRGVALAHGPLIVTTDDDVVMPQDWLERLVAPFADDGVFAVTGNILPLELETREQQLFEEYGGLGRGFERRVFDHAWFWSHRSAVPTWRIGATANAAFRAGVFDHPGIGLFDEALGAGTPTGCSEDTYLYYKILRAGGRIVYDPSAFVWHRHRRTLPALRSQLYNYSRGHVAYHLTTLLRDRDLRALVWLLLQLPYSYAWRAAGRLRGWLDYPLSLILVEIAGNLAGPWALWRSRRRVTRLGPSEPYRMASPPTAASPAPPGTAGGAVPFPPRPEDT